MYKILTLIIAIALFVGCDAATGASGGSQRAAAVTTSQDTAALNCPTPDSVSADPGLAPLPPRFDSVWTTMPMSVDTHGDGRVRVDTAGVYRIHLSGSTVRVYALQRLTLVCHATAPTTSSQDTIGLH